MCEEPKFICKKCHEKDKKVVGCHATFEGHGGTSFEGVCDICGKLGTIRYCFTYANYLHENRNELHKEFNNG